MKRALLITVCMMFAASLAFGQAGNIGVFADPAGASCDLSNSPAGFFQAYIVHVNSPGSTASQFRVVVYGTPLTIIGELSAYNTIGSAAAGIAVAYGPCLVSPIHALTVSYLGISAPCDYIAIEADPTADPPAIYVTDCATPVPNLLTIPQGGIGYLNNNGNCPCNVPAEDTSWGQIKALYQ
jgi:hypothetical protein